MTFTQEQKVSTGKTYRGKDKKSLGLGGTVTHGETLYCNNKQLPALMHALPCLKDAHVTEMGDRLTKGKWLKP